MAEEREQVTPPRRRRRAVGPPGASDRPPPDLGPLHDVEPAGREREDEERLSRERPPHHDRGV